MNDTTFQGNGKVAYVPVVVNAKRKPITNADRIRSMTDEELAHLLHTAEEHLFSGNLWNYEQWRKWLKAPAEAQDG